MAGSKRDDEVARGAESPQLASLRQLAASLPSFDQALDDFIARAHQTDPAVGDAAGTYRNEPAADDSITGVHRARPVPADSITRVRARQYRCVRARSGRWLRVSGCRKAPLTRWPSPLKRTADRFSCP